MFRDYNAVTILYFFVLQVLEKGLGEETRPVAGDLVHVRCEGKLDDGTIVDKNSCLQLILSDEDVITGKL